MVPRTEKGRDWTQSKAEGTEPGLWVRGAEKPTHWSIRLKAKSFWPSTDVKISNAIFSI